MCEVEIKHEPCDRSDLLALAVVQDPMPLTPVGGIQCFSIVP